MVGRLREGRQAEGVEVGASPPAQAGDDHRAIELGLHFGDDDGPVEAVVRLGPQRRAAAGLEVRPRGRVAAGGSALGGFLGDDQTFPGVLGRHELGRLLGNHDALGRVLGGDRQFGGFSGDDNASGGVLGSGRGFGWLMRDPDTLGRIAGGEHLRGGRGWGLGYLHLRLGSRSTGAHDVHRGRGWQGSHLQSIAEHRRGTTVSLRGDSALIQRAVAKPIRSAGKVFFSPVIRPTAPGT